VAEGDSIVAGNVGSLGAGMKVQIVGVGGPGARKKASGKAARP
jgi:hypothetical protein